MEQIAGWVAPAATMVAAIMTASNLGARVTGWGFAVFAVGSVAWVVVALATGQQNLLWTNGFLLAVNLLGVWRWLGRQARYEDGSKAAEAKSAARAVPTLLSLASLPGRKLTDPAGETLGSVVDAMMRCKDQRLAYLVVSVGGAGGMGERLHALRPDDVVFGEDAVRWRYPADALEDARPLQADNWPASLD
jgi:hypothetical protein